MSVISSSLSTTSIPSLKFRIIPSIKDSKVTHQLEFHLLSNIKSTRVDVDIIDREELNHLSLNFKEWLVLRFGKDFVLCKTLLFCQKLGIPLKHYQHVFQCCFGDTTPLASFVAAKVNLLAATLKEFSNCFQTEHNGTLWNEPMAQILRLVETLRATRWKETINDSNRYELIKKGTYTEQPYTIAKLIDRYLFIHLPSKPLKFRTYKKVTNTVNYYEPTIPYIKIKPSFKHKPQRFWKTERECVHILIKAKSRGMPLDGIAVPTATLSYEKDIVVNKTSQKIERDIYYLKKPKGNLRQELIQNKWISPRQKIQYSLCIARGIYILHEILKRGHLNLQRKNILIYAEHLYPWADRTLSTACISNWGHCMQLDDETAKLICEEPSLASPEVAKALKEGKTSTSEGAKSRDCWAFGIILYQIYYGFNPPCVDLLKIGDWAGLTEEYSRMKELKPPDSSDGISFAIYKFMHPDVGQRWTILEGLPFLLKLFKQK